MTEEPLSSRDRLIAAALAGELTAEEQRDFDQACSADPELLSEYLSLREVTDQLAQTDLTWEDQELPPGLADRVFAATSEAPLEGEAPTPSAASKAQRRPSRARTSDAPAARRRFQPVLIGLAAAGLLLVGGFGGSVISGVLDTPPDGPPGALGAVEAVTFPAIPDGTSFEAALVAHTWGTETVLEVDGLAEGDIFEVVLVSEDGVELISGTFFGAEETVICRMNAAVMREDVSQLQIRDVAGAVVVSSSVPDV